MWKLYDWQCCDCGDVRESMINPPDGEDAPRFIVLACPCADDEDGTAMHQRLVSAPAKYLGDRPLTGRVFGGNYDTCGWRTPPAYPELKEGVRHERREVAPGHFIDTKVIEAGALIEHQNRPEWNEAHRARRAMLKEDEARRARAPHLKAGTADLRQQKLPGDPLLSEKRKGIKHAT